MSDLISRQAAIEIANGYCHPANIAKELEKLPSAEPERKKEGKWIEIEKGIKVTRYKCSECGRSVMDDTGYDVSADYPFCHCGARMEGEKC